MVSEAATLLANAPDLDPGSKLILSGISFALDSWHAATVNLNLVGLVTFLLLLSIRLTIKKYRGVDWYALLHALVSGLGSLFAVYLDYHAAETLTGVGEPLRSCQCHGPLTSLHRILPAITMGYSMFDFLDGLTLGVDFALHGAFTLFVMAIFCWFNAPHVVTPFLLMEVSTINLTMVRADFFPEWASVLNQAMFALFFLLFRILVCPYLWFLLVQTMNAERETELYQSCFSPYLFPITFGTGLFFHCLNAFWFYKICRKIQRKMRGEEGIKANNQLNENDVIEQSPKKKKTS